MGWITTGGTRSLQIKIMKEDRDTELTTLSVMIDGLSSFGYNNKFYGTITETQMAQLSRADFRDRLASFSGYSCDYYSNNEEIYNLIKDIWPQCETLGITNDLSYTITQFITFDKDPSPYVSKMIGLRTNVNDQFGNDFLAEHTINPSESRWLVTGNTLVQTDVFTDKIYPFVTYTYTIDQPDILFLENGSLTNRNLTVSSYPAIINSTSGKTTIMDGPLSETLVFQGIDNILLTNLNVYGKKTNFLYVDSNTYNLECEAYFTITGNGIFDSSSLILGSNINFQTYTLRSDVTPVERSMSFSGLVIISSSYISSKTYYIHFYLPVLSSYFSQAPTILNIGNVYFSPSSTIKEGLTDYDMFQIPFNDPINGFSVVYAMKDDSQVTNSYFSLQSNPISIADYTNFQGNNGSVAQSIEVVSYMSNLNYTKS